MTRLGLTIRDIRWDSERHCARGRGRSRIQRKYYRKLIESSTLPLPAQTVRTEAGKVFHTKMCMTSGEDSMEEWQRKRKRYRELSDELQRAYDREIMCLERAQTAHKRAAEQDFLSFWTEIFAAIFYGGNWPGAESRMWDAYVKCASRYVQSVQKELDALGFTFPDLTDSTRLEAIFGPLVEDQNAPGSEITLLADDGYVKKVIIHWVFKDNNGEICYVTSESQPVEES